MADIVIKDRTAANVTLTALTPSAGDTVPARWRLENLTTYAGNRVNALVRSQFNKARTSRRVELLFNYPVVMTDSTTTVQSVRAVATMQVIVNVPQNVPQTDLDNLAVLGSNLAASTLMQAVFASGFAPT